MLPEFRNLMPERFLFTVAMEAVNAPFCRMCSSAVMLQLRHVAAFITDFSGGKA